MAIKSLLGKNIKQLTDSMNNSIKYIDIDYRILNDPDDPWTTHTRSMILHNDYALLNGYRLWLQSKKYDYIRAADFGGLFSNQLNDKVYFSEENEEVVKQLILDESALKWPDIIIIDCKVKAIQQTREWLIHIIIQDKNTKLVMSDDNILINTDN